MKNPISRVAAIVCLVALAGCNSSSADKPAVSSLAIAPTPGASEPVVEPNGTVKRINVNR